jgi:hypothetical protein
MANLRTAGCLSPRILGRIAQNDLGLGLSNIIRCCTEVLPGNIKITG